MQWRQILFSFVIVLGSALWALPFSVFATTSTICVRTASPTPSLSTCPSNTVYAPTGCLSGPAWLGPLPYEHACTASVDTCTATVGQCLSSCDSDTSFRDTSCESAPTSCTQNWCVDKAKFETATIVAGGQPACGAATPPALCPATPPPDCASSPTAPGCATITVGNPLSFSTVEGVLGSLLGTLQGIIVVLALVFIVIGAVLYITSAGDDGRMKTAKGAITAASIGLALGLAAPSFLKQISSILGWTAVTDCTAGTPPPTAADIATCQAAQIALNAGKPLSEIAMNTLQFLLSVVGILGIIMLVIGGITYLTASGDEHRIDSGKGIVKYAIIGIAIALASLIAVTQIAGFFAP